MIKANLRDMAQFLPSRSDRKAAESLSRWSRDFTPAQIHFAQTLLQRAQKFRASGPGASISDDIFSEEPVAAPAPNGTSAPAATQFVEVHADDLADAVKRVVEPGLQAIAQQVDERAEARQSAFNRGAAKSIAQQVLEQAMLELERRKPREVIVRVASDAGTRIVEGHKHKTLADALTIVACGIPCMMVGPAGSGKSTAGEQIAQALGLAFYLQPAASGTHEYLGYKDGNGMYHSTPFRQAFEHGGVFMGEEMDSGSADVPLVVNAGLANGFMAFPDRVEPVRKHVDFRMIANANTYGQGADRVYVGRTQLDGATIDRFAFLDWDYDEALEMRIAPNVAWTERVQRIRAAVVAERARIIVSPRASINGGKLLAQGMPRERVEELVVWKGVDSELRKRIVARI